MKLSASVVLMLISSLAWGAPFVISNPVAPQATTPLQCGIFLDAAPKAVIPATVVATPAGTICKFDVAAVPVGQHTITMTVITTNDPKYGSQESLQSPPLAFSLPWPTPLVAPGGLQLTP